MAINIQFAVAVLFEPATAAADEEEEEAWNPRPTTRERAANTLCAWADPFWTGLTAEALAPSPPDAVVFNVRGVLRPIAPPPVALPRPADASLSLCNSIKLHFFHTSTTPAFGGKEEADPRRDFLYSSAFPLELLLRGAFGAENGAENGEFFGLFNYNRLDTSNAPIPGMRLRVVPSGAPAVVPRGVALLSIAAPDDDRHARVVRLTEWILAALKALCAPPLSPFANARTVGRDRNCITLFQDLALLFEKPWTHLPFTVALYALCGALAVNHGGTPDAFADALRRLPALAPEARRACLRILRDVVVCFSLCAVEGVYWPDMSLQQAVEDQPFPMNFMPARRVFPKDDCEGRALQAQEMCLLLRGLARRDQQLGRAALAAEVRALPSFGPLLAAATAQDFDALLDACVLLGELLAAGVFAIDTTVGDVCFASMPTDGSAAEAHAAEAVGHSFALAFYNNDAAAAEGGGAAGGGSGDVIIVETTGWERGFIPGIDAPPTPADRALVAALHTALGAQFPIVFCGVVPPAVETQIYSRVLLGRGCMYFTAARGERLRFGATIEGLRAQPGGLARAPVPDGAFALDTRAFIAQLCAARPGAPEMLALYDALRGETDAVRRCLRPPPRTTAEFERLMLAHWAPLPPADALRAWWTSQQQESATSGVYFTVTGDRADEAARVVARRFPHALVRTLPWMWSRLFNVRCA